MIAGLLLLALASLPRPSQAEVISDQAGKLLWKAKKKPKGLSYGGRLFISSAPDLRMAGPYEDRWELHSGVDFTVKYRFAKNARFQIGARARYDLRVGDRVEADLLFDLDESWLQFRVGKLTLRVGRMRMTWGRNLVFSPLNQLNPVDINRALTEPGVADARIPVLAVRARFNLAPAAAELIWIPFFQPAALPIWGRDFSLLRPGMLEELLPTLMPDTGVGLVDDQLGRLGTRITDSLTKIDPYARDGIQTYLVANLPEEFPWHGDFGGRFSLTGRGIDLDVMGLWYVLDAPEIWLNRALADPLIEGRAPSSAELTVLSNPGTELVGSRYKRGLMVGLDVSAAFGGFVLTGEGAIYSNNTRYTRRLEPYSTPEVSYALGIRYSYGSVLNIGIEAQHDIALKQQPDTLLLDQNTVRLALVAQVQLFAEHLQLLAAASWSILQRDLYIHPRATVVIDDRIKAIFGLQIFEGFGPDVQPDLDSLLSYRGGAFGYFRDNDYAYGTIELTF